MLRAILDRLQRWWSRLFAGTPRAALPSAPAAASAPAANTPAVSNSAASAPANTPAVRAAADAAPPSGAPPRASAEPETAASSAVLLIEPEGRAAISQVSVVAPPDEETLRAAALGGGLRLGSSGRGATITAPTAELRGFGEALRADARPALTVRQFFARVAAAAPGGLQVDFAAWQGASVERFFFALSAPERSERRGPAMAEAVSTRHAFDGFEWD